MSTTSSRNRGPIGLALALLAALVFQAAPVIAQEEPKPDKIFTGDEVIAATLEAPWRDLLRARQEQVWKGVFRYTGATGAEIAIPVDITLRGLTRRRVCDYPPLRLDFDKQAAKGTEFRGAGNLKLVTHCFRNTRYAQYYIKEYLSYKLYNLVTPMSFRVQGLDLTYLDSNDKSKPLERFGFLIEDPDDVAKRNGLEKLSVQRNSPGQLDPLATSRFMLFQYLVSNLDWSVLGGPGGKCCHNARILGVSADARPLFPVPYDLDASGLVDTHYAAPPENLRVRDVRQRLFRGFCAHNAAVPEALEEFRRLQDDFMALFENEPRLDARTQRNAVRFLAGFYNDLESDKDVQRQLIGNCRG